MPDLLIIRQAELQLIITIAVSLESLNKVFTINHNTKSYWNKLYTVLTLHGAIPCIPTYAFLAASLIHLFSSSL
jgi:sulfite exporter TauE/SafE